MKLNKLPLELVVISYQKEEITPEESQELLSNKAPFLDMVSKDVLEKFQTLTSMHNM